MAECTPSATSWVTGWCDLDVHEAGVCQPLLVLGDAWDWTEPDELDELGHLHVQPAAHPVLRADALAWLPAQDEATESYPTQAVSADANPHDPAWAFGDQAGSHADLCSPR